MQRRPHARTCCQNPEHHQSLLHQACTGQSSNHQQAAWCISDTGTMPLRPATYPSCCRLLRARVSVLSDARKLPPALEEKLTAACRTGAAGQHISQPVEACTARAALEIKFSDQITSSHLPADEAPSLMLKLLDLCDHLLLLSLLLSCLGTA